MLCGWGVKTEWCNLQVKLCVPCLSALEVVTTMRYTNRRTFLCTSGFVDDVMFSHNGANGIESKTALCFIDCRKMHYVCHWNFVRWIWVAIYCPFAALAKRRPVFAVTLCASVRPSVTSPSSTKTAKNTITQTPPQSLQHDALVTLVFWCQRSCYNFRIILKCIRSVNLTIKVNRQAWKQYSYLPLQSKPQTESSK